MFWRKWREGKKIETDREANLDSVVSEGLSKEVIFDLRQEEWKEPAQQRAGGKVLLAERRTVSRRWGQTGGGGVFEMASRADAC